MCCNMWLLPSFVGKTRPLTLASGANIWHRSGFSNHGVVTAIPQEEADSFQERPLKADGRTPRQGVGSRDLLLGDWQQQLEWGTRSAGTLDRTGT